MQVCSSTQSVEVGVAGGNEIGERSDWCKKQVYANLDADAANKEVRRYMEGQQLYYNSKLTRRMHTSQLKDATNWSQVFGLGGAELRTRCESEWNNSALVSALLLTVTVPMLISPPDFSTPIDQQPSAEKSTLPQAQMMLTVFMIFNAIAIACQLLCVLLASLMSSRVAKMPTERAIIEFVKGMWGWMVISYGANIISGVATGFVMVWAAASRCETRALSISVSIVGVLVLVMYIKFLVDLARTETPIFAVHERILANGFDNSNGNETSEPTAASASSPGSSNANHNKHTMKFMTV